MTPAALVGILGKWSKGEGPVYRRLSRAVAAAIERGEIEPGTRLPAERVLAEALARLPDDGRLGLRGAARAGARREPPGQRHARARIALARTGAAPARGSVGVLPAPPRLPQPRRRPGRHDRVSRRAPAGAGPARARDRPRRREGGSASSRAGPGYLPMGLPALRAAIARHLTGLGRRHDGRPGDGDARRAAGDRPGGRALPRARRHGRRRGSDLPRVDRHLHRPRARGSSAVPVGGDAAWLDRLRELVARSRRG